MAAEGSPVEKAALALIRDGKILLARSRQNSDVFYFVGGKPEPGEDDLEALTREVWEETRTRVLPETVQYLRTFRSPMHGAQDRDVRIRLYLGEVAGTPTPSNEVEELTFCDSQIHPKHLTAASASALKWLHARGYIR